MKRLLTILLVAISITAFSQNRAVLRAVEISRQQATPAAPTNYYTLANAANPDSEVNATTGVTVISNGSVASVSSTPTAQNGTYSIKTTVTTVGTASEFSIALSGLTIGQAYTITFYGYIVNSGNWTVGCYDYRGWQTSQTASFIGNAVNTWHFKTINVTANSATPTIRISSTTAGSGTVAFAIDNIIINTVP